MIDDILIYYNVLEYAIQHCTILDYTFYYPKIHYIILYYAITYYERLYSAIKVQVILDNGFENG